MTEPNKPTPASGGNGETPPPFVTMPAADLEKMEQELADYKEKYLRMAADADNMRKRLQKERQELVQFAIENVIGDLLDPIDQLEQALSFTNKMTGEMKHWALGFQMILKQFKDVLAGNGVVEFHSEGQTFDPNLHEAVEAVPTRDRPPGSVITECRRGYKMGTRVIRPARVKVAKTPEETAPQPSGEEEVNQGESL